MRKTSEYHELDVMEEMNANVNASRTRMANCGNGRDDLKLNGIV